MAGTPQTTASASANVALFLTTQGRYRKTLPAMSGPTSYTPASSASTPPKLAGNVGSLTQKPNGTEDKGGEKQPYFDTIRTWKFGRRTSEKDVEGFDEARMLHSLGMVDRSC